MFSLGQPEACLTVEKAADPTPTQEAHGFQCLAGCVHRVEAVGRKLDGVDRWNARDQEDKPSSEVALLRLVLATQFRFAATAVDGAKDMLTPAKDTNRALAITVDRHLFKGHAVPFTPVGRILGPVFELTRAIAHESVRHDGLPDISGKDHGEAI